MNGPQAGATLARALELRRRRVGGTDVSVIAPADGRDRPQARLAQLAGALSLLRCQLVAAPVEARQRYWMPPRLINASVLMATGQLLFLLRSGQGDLSDDDLAQCPRLVAGFADPRLGLSMADAFVFMRHDVWLALGGLEEAYGTERWALADLERRVAAIGGRVEGARRPALTGPAAGLEASDREVYERRWPISAGISAAAGSGDRAPVQPGHEPARSAVIYTAITHGYDTLKRQSSVATSGGRTVAFVDEDTRETTRAAGWELVPLTSSDADPRRRAKYPKVLPHRLFAEADYSLWIDGSVLAVAPFGLERLVDVFLDTADLCVFAHSRRGCAYEEASYCSALGLDDSETIRAQMSRYAAEGFPLRAGLGEASVILRRHTAAMAEFNELWWREIEHGSSRDQLSLPYVVWKTGLSYNRFPLSLTTGNGVFAKTVRT